MVKKAAALLLVLCLVFAGCGAQTGEEQSGLNLKDITVSPIANDEAKITLSFISGSRNAGVSEGTISSAPKYEAEYIEAPGRLEIKLYGVEYADFEAVKEDMFVYGTFSKAPTEEQPYTLYIQLKANKGYDIKENGSNIEISIKTGEKLSGKSCVVLNAYGSKDEPAAKELGFTPTLASDLKNIVMISETFDSSDDANAYIEKNSEKLSKLSVAPYVVTMEGELPVYNISGDVDSLKSVEMIQKDGKAVTLASIYTGARFVCSSKDGKAVYAKTIQPDYTQDVEQITREQLFIEGITAKNLETKQFYSVKQAEFSKNGRYLAILDNSPEMTILYLYDCQTEVLKNIGEEGFGGFTSSFVWDTSNTIYAMTGDTVFGLMSYNAENGKISAVEERKGAISDVTIAGDNLYFCDGGKVFSVSIKTGERKEFASGVYVIASENGQYLSVLEPASEEVELYNIKVYDIKSGKKYTAAENVLMQNMLFVGNTLYATVPADTDGEYAYRLIAFKDGATIEAGNVLTEKIQADNANEALILVYSKYFGGSEYTANYRYSV